VQTLEEILQIQQATIHVLLDIHTRDKAKETGEWL